MRATRSGSSVPGGPVVGGPVRGGPVPGARLIRLYPEAWRERYGDEFLAVLEAGQAATASSGASTGTPFGRPAARLHLDIVRGALDAHLHPAEPSTIPGLAAVLGGGLWIIAAAPIAALPAPPDWPGYLVDSLPLAILAVLALAVAVVGVWLRADGRGGVRGRRLAIVGVTVALIGHLAWAVALVVTFLGLGYGAPLALASTLAGLGTVLIGLALARAGDWPIAGLLVAAPVLLVIPPSIVPIPAAWIAFGTAWIGVGLVELFGQPRTVGPFGRAT